ncbi:MAG: Gfo/Idh/MocA family oxidoreductase, partial [Verrucomicrobia bacterium]|nr:Gfo/Idh/MocA family oxidoreductase [Verrucomicrobiota bacterium]
MNKQDQNLDLNRRDFLKDSSLTTLMVLMGGVALRAEDKPASDAAAAAEAKPKVAPVPCAVIGCGVWGREILSSLASVPEASVVGICDTYEPYLRRSKRLAPKAETYSDYHQLLAQKDLKAVVVATPTYLHRDVAIAALQAGKH